VSDRFLNNKVNAFLDVLVGIHIHHFSYQGIGAHQVLARVLELAPARVATVAATVVVPVLIVNFTAATSTDLFDVIAPLTLGFIRQGALASVDIVIEVVVSVSAAPAIMVDVRLCVRGGCLMHLDCRNGHC